MIHFIKGFLQALIITVVICVSWMLIGLLFAIPFYITLSFGIIASARIVKLLYDNLEITNHE